MQLKLNCWISSKLVDYFLYEWIIDNDLITNIMLIALHNSCINLKPDKLPSMLTGIYSNNNMFLNMIKLY